MWYGSRCETAPRSAVEKYFHTTSLVRGANSSVFGFELEVPRKLRKYPVQIAISLCQLYTIKPRGIDITGVRTFFKRDYLENGDMKRSKESVNRRLSTQYLPMTNCSLLVANGVVVETIAFEKRSLSGDIDTSGLTVYSNRFSRFD